MLCHLIACWAVGLPAGYLLYFDFGRGNVGRVVRSGNPAGKALLWVWWGRARDIREAASDVSSGAAISQKSADCGLS